MNGKPIMVEVDSGIRDLMPVFLEQRKSDQQALDAAIREMDCIAVRRVAHGMAGAGSSYGFEHITQLGEALVEAARIGDLALVVRIKAEFDRYMARLVVKYV